MADELYLLTIHGNHSGQHNEVGMYFHGSNLTLGEVVDNAQDLVDGFVGNCLPAWLDLMPASYEVERVTARRIVPQFGVTVGVEFQDGDQPGSITGGAASQQLCPVIRLIPPMGTKSAGKFFLPCIAESQINANTPNSTWFSNVASFMGSILTNVGLGSIIWLSAVYSTKLNTYVDTSTFDTSSTIGFQRRRQRPF